ncbi:MAG: helix-turn-helix domain-containing protein [Lachnospiraceae bacterium]|nr:helix-turn-helix domain-containing protein [Lachnospiraceae bacterium]
MPFNTHKSLYENIKHQTNTSPYLVHYTQIAAHMNPALYMHWHNEMEFLVLTKGKLLLHIEDRSFLLLENEAVFIPPGLLHMGEHSDAKGCCFYAYVFSPDFLFSSFETDKFNKYIQPILHNKIDLALHLTHDSFWHRTIMDYLQQIVSAEQEELAVRGLTYLIWDVLYKNHLLTCSAIDTTAAQNERFNGVIDYIREHYQEYITLGQMAELTHLSEGQFCRLFKAFTGMSPNQYLIRYRILQSCRLLLKTDTSITDIALSCGFNNISYYNRAFLKIMNTTPGAYRRFNRRSI